MNTPVKFELAKLLKEKGFSQNFGNGQKFYYPLTKELTENHRGDNYAAPTISEVVMWLYKKHDIWIWVEHYPNETNFIPQIPKANLDKILGYYKSPTEAYEAAIEYTLKNLIK